MLMKCRRRLISLSIELVYRVVPRPAKQYIVFLSTGETVEDLQLFKGWKVRSDIGPPEGINGSGVIDNGMPKCGKTKAALVQWYLPDCARQGETKNQQRASS